LSYNKGLESVVKERNREKGSVPDADETQMADFAARVQGRGAGGKRNREGAESDDDDEEDGGGKRRHGRDQSHGQGEGKGGSGGGGKGKKAGKGGLNVVNHGGRYTKMLGRR
jgi:hypothetical protein